MNWLHLQKPPRSKTKRKVQDLQLAVKVFPTRQFKLDHGIQAVRYLVFQLKDLMNRGKLHLPINKNAILDSYFAQAELGDYNQENHGYGYLEGRLGSTSFCHPSYMSSNFDISEAVYENMVTDLHTSPWPEIPDITSPRYQRYFASSKETWLFNFTKKCIDQKHNFENNILTVLPGTISKMAS